MHLLSRWVSTLIFTYKFLSRSVEISNKSCSFGQIGQILPATPKGAPAGGAIAASSLVPAQPGHLPPELGDRQLLWR